MRKTGLSPLRRVLIVACVLSIMLVGFYTTHVHLGSPKITHRLDRSTRWPNCPIPAHVDDVCIHSQANSKDIMDRCGSKTVSLGDCQDRFYDLTVTTKEFMLDVNENTHVMVVQGDDIGGDMDEFVQKRSRWMIDTMGGKGYERLTSFGDKKRLDLQQHLDQLQHRCDHFFNGAINPFGFGSMWHTWGLGLAYGLYYNMTLFTPGDHKNFIPMTSCTEADMQQSFRAHPPETDFSRWSTHPINFKSVVEEEDVGLMMKNSRIIPWKYWLMGHFWWRSMLTYYAIRPNAQMRELIRNTTRVTTPCISVHVRHSDKIMETKLIDFSTYMEDASRYKAKTGVSNIYLMTDDAQVIAATKEYLDFKFQYMDIPRSNQGWAADRDAGLSMERQEKNFLIDIFSAAQCQHSIVTYSSNVGRILAEVAYATKNEQPDVVSLDRGWEMAP